MDSKIADAIKMTLEPVAVVWTDTLPDGAVQHNKNEWACFTSFLVKAARGKVVAFDRESHLCNGGLTGIGFGHYDIDRMEHFLAHGRAGERGERYVKTPEYARAFLEDLPEINVTTKYVVLKPLPMVTADDDAKALIFLVNADQLSALVTLANYDRPTNDNVVTYFGAGCHSTVMFPVAEGDKENPKAIIGMTDPSARKFLNKDLLSFSLPYRRFLELEAEADESFLITDEWKQLAKRIR
jgi:uncharacterized protein (DUF169 family)